MTTEPPPIDVRSMTPAPRRPDTLWPTLCHVCALAGGVVPFGNIIGPIIIWQVKKDELPEVVAHAKEVLNFQITVMIALLACVPLFFLGALLFFPFLLLFPWIAFVSIGALVCTIIGIVQASEGRFYTYPMTIRFIK